MEIAYDGDRYRNGVTKVRNARKAIDQLPENIRAAMLKAAVQIVRGVGEAYKEIYDPTTNSEDALCPGSPTDFETDKKGLGELEKIFQK
ncbi:hypothetical protein KY349_01455 [Candidatus Woesearchaeota archaeon]|nr:hypothetical protein [Candidatus Woesearchaeota archaeon]